MGKHQIRFEQFFAAPREKVFAYFADHNKLSRIWGGRIQRVKDSADPADPNGLGSVREVHAKGFSLEETIVKYQKPAVIEYTVSKGGPVKNHLGHLEFREIDGGTKIEYTITFDPKVPLTGGILATMLCATWHAGVHHAVEDLAKAA